MNYSDKTYGRKIIRKKNIYIRRFILLMVICVLVGGLVGSLITGLIVHNKNKDDVEPFGKSENITFAAEVPLEWSGKDEFIPLDVPVDKDLQEYIYYLSYSYNIDFSLVMALIETESNFTSNIISKTNDYGLMQINKVNHKWLSDNLGITDFLDSKQNVKAGIYVLRRLFDVNGNNTPKVLMAYNMGQNGANTSWNKGIHSTRYTNKIIKRQKQFQNELIKRKDGMNNE